MTEHLGVTVIKRQGAPLDRKQAEDQLSSEGISPQAWQNGPDYRYLAHEHAYTKVLYCVEGGIVFHPRDSDGVAYDVKLEEGDRIELASGVLHAATVGPNGVICVEGARTRG